ncbi:Replication factor A protein 3 [Yarrowia sp. C11]|nr:Replication factor A protein 3 [Yarrowia sp. E02]KAG5369225.1 Replication factor A protein 3 [Yarrowia sp. C11]
MLGDFYGKTVRIIGKVESQDGDIVNLDANGPVKVKSDGSDYVVGRFYEVVGKVEGSDQIVGLTSTDFGENINPEQVNKLVGYCQKFPTVFGDA